VPESKLPRASKIVPSFSIKITLWLLPVAATSRAVTPSADIAVVGTALLGSNVTALTPFALRLSNHASAWSVSTVLRITAVTSRPISPIAVIVSERTGRTVIDEKMRFLSW